MQLGVIRQRQRVRHRQALPCFDVTTIHLLVERLSMQLGVIRQRQRVRHRQAPACPDVDYCRIYHRAPNPLENNTPSVYLSDICRGSRRG